MKPKPTFGKYPGKIIPDTSYMCTSDGNILRVENITRQKDVWMVNLKYTHSSTKLGTKVSIVEFDFVQEIANRKFVEL